MSNYKLSSEEVPKKFAEWLLSMGCPPEKVPTLDKVVEMCRGQYYMVWRSLMEHVEPKGVIRQKRLHVFCDDVYKWKRKNAFNKPDPSTVMPEELTLWHQHCDVKEKVANAEERVKKARQNLNLLMDKISTKMSQHELSRRGLQRAQRRAWLLQQVAGELTTKRENLVETRSIADSLCSTQEDVDVQSKLEKYLLSKRSPSSRVTAPTSLLATNPVASSSVVSNGDVIDNEEQLFVLARSRGAALWPRLLARRAGLVTMLRDAPTNLAVAGPNPQSVVAHTAAMHCNLALEALKHRAHIKQTRRRLAAAVSDLNTYLSGEACELLVVRCEQARAVARVAALRSLLTDVTSRTGLFAAAEVAGERAGGREIAAVDKAIESKKEEIKKLVAALAATEKKMYGARECLISIFNGFHKDSPLNENQSMNRYRGQVELPQESMATLRQFYEERRGKRTRKVELSLDLDTSDNCSFTEIDNATPKFADELRIYLKKFNLENNRKLVLESGEKIWAFETMESAIERLYIRLKNSESDSILVCPSVGLSRSLKALAERVSLSAALDSALAAYTSSLDRRNFDIDITPKIKEEEALVDQVKKRLNDNLLSLQKTGKTLELGQENLRFWSQNEMKKHISCSRVINGKTYKEYEEIYVLHLE